MEDRRLIVFAILCGALFCPPGVQAAHTLQAERKVGQTDRVVAMLEVGGETEYAEQGKPRREKMNVVCRLNYLEKTVAVPSGAGGTARSVREYEKVQALVKVGDGRFEPTLRPEHRLIAVETTKQSATLFSPAGALSRDELDAIDIQGNSLLLDQLLPNDAVSVGDHWRPAEAVLAALLGLDEVAKSTVQCSLKEITPEVARFELAGHVEGAIYGVSTNIDTKAKFRLDLHRKRIDWLGMLVKERRPASYVTDGVDVISRLQLTITPAKETEALGEAALAKRALEPTPERLYLCYEPPVGGWQCHYDRRWYIHHQREKSPAAVLRLLDRGMLAGQCNLASLADHAPASQISLEEFQNDVRRALGKSFGEFVEASQSANAAKYRVYRVVVHGTSSDIAMRWIYYLVADPKGRQVAFTFAVEQNGVDRFADADKPLIESLRFVETERVKEAKEDHEVTKTQDSR